METASVIRTYKKHTQTARPGMKLLNPKIFLVFMTSPNSSKDVNFIN